MTIRHALFIDGAWADSGGDAWTTLVTVDRTGIEIKPYTEAELCDVLRFTFEELAAIVELVGRATSGTGDQQEATP